MNDDETVRLLGLNDPESVYRRLSNYQTLDAASSLVRVAERAAVLARYLEARTMGASPQAAEAHAASLRRAVRKALGYTVP